MPYKKRIADLRVMMKDKGLAGVYITSAENVFYMSGFTGFGDARLYITDSGAWIITDSRYTVQSAAECPDYTLISGNSDNISTLDTVLTKADNARIGFENEKIAYRDYKALRERFAFAEFEDLNGYFTEIRDIKDNAEIALIEKACSIACTSFNEILSIVRPGVAEADVAAELEYRMKKNGASDRSFDTIVASGVRSAMPHGVASDKKIENGDVVTIDFGCIYKHYCSDMTRTFFVGKPDARLEKIYNIVYKAQMAALASYKSGMTGAELDNISREIISAEGYGEYFGHGLGHGVGIEIHEGASINKRNSNVIKDNTVFSIEPGIYVEGLGGVRIEDLVVLQNGSLRILTGGSDKKMLVL